MWATVQEVALAGKTGEYIVPGPTVKGMPKKRRSRGLAKPPKGGFKSKAVPDEEPMPKQPPTPKVPTGSRSQKDIRDYPQYADMLDIKPISVMGLTFPANKLRLPFANVSKDRRFIKGVDWAVEKLAVKPMKELADQERNAKANLKRLKGATADRIEALNKVAPMRIPRVTSPFHMILNKMSEIAARKGGGARTLEQSGDPFWLGVLYLSRALSKVAPWSTLDDWVVKETIRLFKKHAGLDIDINTGKIVIPSVAEAKGETAHDKCGRFCAGHKAHTVTRDGNRYKPVRQLRKIKGAKTRSKRKPPQEEAVFSVIGAPMDREAVDAMLHPSGQWKTAAEVMPRDLSEE